MKVKYGNLWDEYAQLKQRQKEIERSLGTETKINAEIKEKPICRYPKTDRYQVTLKAYWVEKNETRAVITRTLIAHAQSKAWAIGQARQTLKLEIPKNAKNLTIQTLKVKKANYETQENSNSRPNSN